MPWWKTENQGSRWTLFHGTATFSAMLVRSGSRVASAAHTWEWQVRQVWADGIPAAAARSTELWQ
jgi:hypothetical protein